MEPLNNAPTRRRTLLHAILLICAVMVLSVGAMTVFRSLTLDKLPGAHHRQIGVAYIEGLLADVEPELDFLDELENDDSVLGVLVRVNSPGGPVVPAQDLYDAIWRLAEAKPVVVSMGQAAASGGYYLSAPADKIFATRGTITGSIGVRMDMSNFQGLMEKLGLNFFSLTSGPFKDAGTPFRQLSDQERAYFQGLVNDLHEQFVEDIAAGRGMNIEQVRILADGKALTGRQAQAVGLVDELGGMDDALKALEELCEVQGQDLPLLEGPEIQVPLLQRLMTSLGIDLPTGRSSIPRFQYVMP